MVSFWNLRVRQQFIGNELLVPRKFWRKLMWYGLILFSSFFAPFSFSNFTWSVVRLEHFRFFQAATTTPECVLNSNRTSDGYTFCSELKVNNIQLELTFVLSGLVLQISLHPILDKTTYHLINKERLALMKPVTSFLCPNLFLLVWIEVQKSTSLLFWALLYVNNNES